MPGWKEATAVQKLSSNTYISTLHDDWCIGSGKLPTRTFVPCPQDGKHHAFCTDDLEQSHRITPCGFVLDLRLSRFGIPGTRQAELRHANPSIVPNGGYVTGMILEVVKTHFATSLAKQDQPHTIALHVEFLRRTQAGPATFKVDDVKLGRQTSIVHVTMEQE